MTTWFNDTFTEAATTALTAHTSNSGASWVNWFSLGANVSPNVYTSFGGVAASGQSALSVYRESVIAPAADVTVNATFHYDSNQFNYVGVLARANAGASAAYAALYDSGVGKWKLFRVGASGAATELAASASLPYSSGATPAIEFIVTGAGATVTLTLNVNSSLAVSYSDTAADRVVAAGYVGMWLNTSAAATGMFINSLSADSAGVADTTVPTMSGSITASSVTSNGFTLAWSAAGDDVAVTGYQVSVSTGADSYANVGNVLTVTESGLAASTLYNAKVRAYDAAGNYATPLSTTVTTSAAASTVSGVTVSPSTATVSGGATQVFTATVAGTGSPSQSVAWSVSAGSIDTGGTFTAPAATGSIQTITVTATSAQDGTKAGAATVTVPATVRTATITLTDGANPHVSLTGLKWAFFDQSTPDALLAPADTGTAETTDGSGVLSIDIAGSTLGAGGTGWLIVSDSNGTTTFAHKAFSGPVTLP